MNAKRVILSTLGTARCHAHAGVGMWYAALRTLHAHGKRGHGTRLTLLAVGIALLAGCTPSEPPRPAAPPPQPTAQPAPQPVPQPAPTVVPNATPQAVTPQPAPPPATVEKKAEVGVGEKGRGYGRGVIATPLASYFAMKERLVYEIEIPEAMKLFKATEDRAPKSHEEFMERIIKENHIVLPLLPEGHRYQYDPKTEQLMVEQPAP